MPNELKRLQAALWLAETESERNHYRRLVELARYEREENARVTRAIELDLGLAYGAAVVLW